jgi:hypothetical protein
MSSDCIAPEVFSGVGFSSEKMISVRKKTVSIIAGKKYLKVRMEFFITYYFKFLEKLFMNSESQ